jgi:phage shock protein E
MFKKILISLFIGIIVFATYKQILFVYEEDKLREVLKEEVFLVDVRTPEEYNFGTVKGAVNIPLDRLTNELNTFKGKKNIIVFCRSGKRSKKAKNILIENGFKNVYNGGAWINLNKLINE